MSLAPEQYLIVAKQLKDEADNGSKSAAPLSEAKWRCAVSRAYYAAFWAGLNYWSRHAPSYKLKGTGEDHDLVAENFWVLGDKGIEISENLKSLRQMRNVADYEPGINNPKAKATQAIETANRVLNDIGGLDD